MCMTHLDFESRLASQADLVWSVVSTMTGVNDELFPWMRMTVPGGRENLAMAENGMSSTGFSSWLLAGRVLPIDRHRLRLERVFASGHAFGFDERSTSALQRLWVHQRRVRPDRSGGCILTDHLEITPRISLLTPVVGFAVTRLFRHRHRRLRRRFGSGQTGVAC
jgi:ligand-binding SRPBCC domain-containing protein